MTDPANLQENADDKAFLDSFYERTVPRMLRTMLVAGIMLLGPMFWYYGWAGAAGVAAGLAASYINFRLLVSGVEALGERIVQQQSKERGWAVVARFLLRYAFVGVTAYAIFIGSALAFRGFLWGLSLPVVAMMVEAAVEVWVGFRK
jgi:hypothetical protein